MAQRKSEMSEVVDLAAFRDSRNTKAKKMNDALQPAKEIDWLASIIKNNLTKNLNKIANIIGDRALEPFFNKTVIPVLYTSSNDIEPCGMISVFTAREKRVKKVNVCVTNNLAFLFGAVSRKVGADENAGHVAALFTVGAIVAAGSMQTISPVNKSSANADLWRSVGLVDQPLTTEYFRFAGGVVSEIFGPIEWVGLNPGVTPTTPQEAALINPLTLPQMKRSLVPVY